MALSTSLVRLALAPSVAALLCVIGLPGLAGAQVTSPGGGTTNTLTLEGTVESISPKGDTMTVKGGDGLTQIFRLTSKLFVHDNKPAPDDALSDLHRGMAVVVHYRAEGLSRTAEEVDRLDGQGLQVTEGRVVSIDRGRGEIKVRLEGDRTETLKLSTRAVLSSGRNLDAAKDAPVVVYYSDEKGERVVHYFRQK
jgi:hypothetical protein